MIRIKFQQPGQALTYVQSTYSVIGPLQGLLPNTKNPKYDFLQYFPKDDCFNQSKGHGGVDNNLDQRITTGTLTYFPRDLKETFLSRSGLVGLTGVTILHAYSTASDGTPYHSGYQAFCLHRINNIVMEVWVSVGEGSVSKPPTNLQYYHRINYNFGAYFEIKGRPYVHSTGKYYDGRYPYVYLPDAWSPSSIYDFLALETKFTGSTRGGTLYNKLSYTTPVVDESHESKLIITYLETLFKKRFIAPSMDYGELVYDAVTGAKRNEVNMISFLKDLRHPLELIPKLKKMSMLKDITGNYLNVKYGILPTVDDLKGIVEAFKKLPYTDRTGNTLMTAGRNTQYSLSPVSCKTLRRIKIAVATEDDALQSLYQRMSDIGIFPSFQNLWDLVPYSFVIDWFIDVGDFLGRIDTSLMLSTLNIQYVTSSQKDTFYLQVDNIALVSFVGSITRKHYHRWVSDQCPVPSFIPEAKLGFDHWFEAGALLAQRRK